MNPAARPLLAALDALRARLRGLTQTAVVWVPWLDVPLLVTPGCNAAHAMREPGAPPVDAWCSCEVVALLEGLVAALARDAPARRSPSRPAGRPPRVLRSQPAAAAMLRPPPPRRGPRRL